MSKEIIKEDIIRLLQTIVEQTQTIDAYKGKIPQIEIDLIQDNIRHLYQNFMYLDRMNQGDTVNADLTKTKEKASRSHRPENTDNRDKKETVEPKQETDKQQETEPASADHVENTEAEKNNVETEKSPENQSVAEPKTGNKEENQQKETLEKPEENQTEQDNKSGQKVKAEEKAEMKEDEEAERQEKQENITPEKNTETQETAAKTKEKKDRVSKKQKETTEASADTKTQQEKPAKEEKKAEPEKTRKLFDQDISSTVADKFKDSGNSINDWFGNGQKQGTLGDRLKKKPVKDIKVAIGINEKFLFINELFNGNMHDYNDAIKNLNRAGSLENAAQIFDELAQKYKWDKDAQSTLQLLDFVERRYMQ